MTSKRLIELPIRPGIRTMATARGAAPFWKDGDKVRFKNGLPQKIGGWEDQEIGTVVGLARALHDWRALDDSEWVAIGTHEKLYLWDGTTLSDITPLQDSGNLADPFTTTSGSAIVTVDDTAHSLEVGDHVHFSGATAVGGITVDGEYTVTAVNTANQYTITHSSNATSSAGPGGGTVAYEYEISIGTGDNDTITGYGTSTYSAETWDTPRTTSNTIERLRVWSLDNWGEDLIASPYNGAVYHWDKTSGASTRASLIANAPSTNRRVFVSTEDRKVVALGAHTGSSDDAMRVAWCDTEDFDTWTATSTNAAGSKRLDVGSELITSVKTRGGHLLWTDEAVYEMRPTGDSLIYGFRLLAASVRIIGPNAAVEHNGIVMFMGTNDFYVFDGTLRPMPCDVWETVFEDINEKQQQKVFASINQLFSEVWFFYPSSTSEENDRYVVYNYMEEVWYTGTIERLCFHDQSLLFSKPYGIDSNGVLFKHESTFSADGSAMSDVFIESHDMDIQEGDHLWHIDKLIPDFEKLLGEVTVTLKGKKYPHDSSYTSLSSGTVDNTTKKLSVRARARQIALRIESSGDADEWRMGAWRAQVRPHGRR